MFGKIVKSTVASQVIDQIKQLLAEGQLRPGDKLPAERQLAEMLGVSRPSLREALRALEYASVLETRVGEGIFVASSSSVLENTIQTAHLVKQFALEEMLTVRRSIEVTAMRLVVARASDDDIETIGGLCDQGDAAVDDLESFLRNDYEFHHAIAEASGNKVLITVLQTMRAMMRAFNAEILLTREDRQKVAVMHRDVFESLKTRDEGIAVMAMEKHLDNVIAGMKALQDTQR